MSEIPNDIWQDPQVKEALKSGRSAWDIMVLPCPDCNRWGYYNQGSSFSCRFCDKSWYVCSEDEPTPKPTRFMDAFDMISLHDTLTVTTDGYHNETRNP